MTPPSPPPALPAKDGGRWSSAEIYGGLLGGAAFLAMFLFLSPPVFGLFVSSASWAGFAAGILAQVFGPAGLKKAFQLGGLVGLVSSGVHLGLYRGALPSGVGFLTLLFGVSAGLLVPLLLRRAAAGRDGLALLLAGLRGMFLGFALPVCLLAKLSGLLFAKTAAPPGAPAAGAAPPSGAGNATTPETELWGKLHAAGMPKDVLAMATDEFKRMQAMHAADETRQKSEHYLRWLAELPWSKRSEDAIDLEKAKLILDRDHAGLTQVKEFVLDYLAVRKKTKAAGGDILCFLGPPGVGKTSIAKAIAEAMGRRYVSKPLGGVDDVTVLRGHRRTYLDSSPGALLALMREAGTANPVFLLDEIDKVSKTGRGDPSSALLEVLDPAQNAKFRDDYLGVPYDLSQVLFITTANSLDTIPAPLRSRMTFVTFSSYSTEEKLPIADIMAEAARKEAGLSPDQARLFSDTARALIEGYTFEAGVRKLQQALKKLMRSISARAERYGEAVPAFLRARDLEKYLGPARHGAAPLAENGVGVGTGLAVSENGGHAANLEVVAVKGEGSLRRLPRQMREMSDDSAQNAYAYLMSLGPDGRSVAETHGASREALAQWDLRLAFTPAMPMDGPSAGVLLASAMLSRLSGRPLRRGVAMTGEITPTGRVLAVGGIKEKVLAAARMGLKAVVFPADNLRDLEDVPPSVRESLKLVPVRSAEEAFAFALEPAAAR